MREILLLDIDVRKGPGLRKVNRAWWSSQGHDSSLTGEDVLGEIPEYIHKYAVTEYRCLGAIVLGLTCQEKEILTCSNPGVLCH
jgi:hypothetical protein